MTTPETIAALQRLTMPERRARYAELFGEATAAKHADPGLRRRPAGHPPGRQCRRGSPRYRYYTCTNAQKRGWKTCPSKSIPAAELEKLAVEQVRCVGQDKALVQETLAQIRLQEEARSEEWHAEQRVLDKDLARWHT